MMDGFGDRGSTQDSSNIQDFRPFAENPTGNAVFDASQYAFFGNNVVEEVELGGIEDEEGSASPVGFTEEEFLLHKDEGNLLELHSDIDDLSSTFSKLTRPTVAGVDNYSVSQQTGSSAADVAQDADFTNWFDQHAFDAETIHRSEKWPSHSSSHFIEPNSSLYRASSFPDQQPEQHHLLQQDPRLHPLREQNIPSFTSYPPLGGRSEQGSLNGQSSYPNNNLYHSPTVSSSSSSVFPSSQLQFLPRVSQLGENLPQLTHGHPVNSQVQSQWMTKGGLHYRNNSGLPNNFPTHHNGQVPPQLIPSHHSQHNRMKHPFQPSVGHVTGLQSQPLNPQFSLVNNFDMRDLNDQRVVSLLRRQGMNYPHQGLEKVDGGRPRFRFKYMSQAELENIHRMQLAAIHSNDPYVEDYYNQACLFRKSTGAKLKHHFCPTNPWDSSSKPAAINEPHPFLQVDALGRVSFSSIRRPRPLLEVDHPNPSGTESKLPVKPLAHEPLLASREMIEDGFKLLLDVDDIDRFVQFNQLQDGGAQLRQRRHVLLEDLASSLKLVDPLGKNRGVNLSPKEDHVFLRIASLPKGRKLLLKYVELLLPGELTRIVSMAIFRNLRFLFGNLTTDPDECSTTCNLAKAVSSCVGGMELKALAACLASVVCSQEHPPLHPVGSPAGDGASVILKSVLERATELLTDPHAGGNCSDGNRAFWQASFDAFFGILIRYSFNKYDLVVQSFVARGSPVVTSAESDVAKAVSKEIPIEVLRASLPHTSKEQRKVLLEFAQKSMPVLGFSGGSC